MRKVLFFVFIFLFNFLPFYKSFAQIESIDLIPIGVTQDGESFGGFMSSDGRYITFASTSTNLVAGDTNENIDIFIYDAVLDTTERVSVATGGAEAHGNSNIYITRVSDDGRYVAFPSTSPDLVAGDTNGFNDVFVHDRTLNTTERVSVATGGAEGDGDIYSLDMSSDGRYVAFSSEATNLVEGDTNAVRDVFVHDRTLDTTERVSISTGGAEGDGQVLDSLIDISDDGRYVAFSSEATNMVDSDTNEVSDIFVHDRTLDTTERVSVATGGIEGNEGVGELHMSSDGRYVVFFAGSNNLVSGDSNNLNDVFVHDRTLDTTERVSVATGGVEANGESTIAFISDTGRMIVFISDATNLVSGDSNSLIDAFLHDRITGITERISLQEDGSQASGGGSSTGVAIISDNGQFVTLTSDFTNLVAGDSNGGLDLFLLEITDDDGISATIEKSAPNDGDADDSTYIDSVEHNVTSLSNSVSGAYTSVVAGEPGQCLDNESTAVVTESSLASSDALYDYPLGIVDFSVNCNTSGDDLNVTLYFYGNFSADDYVLRKFNSSNNTYSNITGATLSNETIDGNSVIKVEYTVSDGGELDEDGLANGVIVDPVGLGLSVVTESSGGGSSSGSRPRKKVALNETQTSVFEKENKNFCKNFSTLMKNGVKGTEVSTLQEYLKNNNFNPGPIDGVFGPMTNTAVKEFQKKNNLVSDGIVGPKTRAVLNSGC